MTATTSSHPPEPTTGGLRVLVVDDEGPARADLEFLLHEQPAVATVDVAADATEAVRRLQADRYDGVFLDILMPGLDGLELARLLLRFADPPVVVFVTAYDSHAVAAFEARARGYLLKPVSSERLADAVALIADARRPAQGKAGATDDGVSPASRRTCRSSPEKSVARNSSTSRVASPIVCCRAPMLTTFASLCCRASVAVSSFQTSAARIPLTLLAAIASPFPEPPMTMPRLPRSAAVLIAAAMMYGG